MDRLVLKVEVWIERLGGKSRFGTASEEFVTYGSVRPERTTHDVVTPVKKSAVPEQIQDTLEN